MDNFSTFSFHQGQIHNFTFSDLKFLITIKILRIIRDKLVSFFNLKLGMNIVLNNDTGDRREKVLSYQNDIHILTIKKNKNKL